MFAAGVPTASGPLLQYVVATGFVLPVGGGSSRAVASTAATSTHSYQIEKNGVIVGYIEFAAASAVGTFTNISSPVTFVPGDLLTIRYSLDVTLADISITLVLNRV